MKSFVVGIFLGMVMMGFGLFNEGQKNIKLHEAQMNAKSAECTKLEFDAIWAITLASRPVWYCMNENVVTSKPNGQGEKVKLPSDRFSLKSVTTNEGLKTIGPWNGQKITFEKSGGPSKELIFTFLSYRYVR